MRIDDWIRDDENSFSGAVRLAGMGEAKTLVGSKLGIVQRKWNRRGGRADCDRVVSRKL